MATPVLPTVFCGRRGTVAAGQARQLRQGAGTFARAEEREVRTRESRRNRILGDVIVLIVFRRA